MRIGGQGQGSLLYSVLVPDCWHPGMHRSTLYCRHCMYYNYTYRTRPMSCTEYSPYAYVSALAPDRFAQASTYREYMQARSMYDAWSMDVCMYDGVCMIHACQPARPSQMAPRMVRRQRHAPSRRVPRRGVHGGGPAREGAEARNGLGPSRPV